VVIGGFAQLALVIGDLHRAGFLLKLVRPRWSDRMKRLVSLGVPGVLAGGITQINIVVGTMIASLQAGAVSLLYYADRLYQLPLGVVGIAIGVVLLPELSRRLKAGDEAGVNVASARSLEFAMLLTLPAAVALAAIPLPLVSVLFERGAFGEEARFGTAAALQAFAVGLPSFVLIKVFSPAFFAREDTRTPMLVGGAIGGGERCLLAGPVPLCRSCRHCAGHQPCWLGQCAGALPSHGQARLLAGGAGLCDQGGVLFVCALAMGGVLIGLAGPVWTRQLASAARCHARRCAGGSGGWWASSAFSGWPISPARPSWAR
jgi:hypothetical protein